MLVKIENECPNVANLMEENPSMTFAWVMGRDIEDISDIEKDVKLIICGTAICDVYIGSDSVAEWASAKL